MSKKRFLLSVAPLYLSLFMGDAFLTSFFSLYFAYRGMDSNQVSILLGVIPFFLFLGCFLGSLLAKTPKRALWLYRIFLLLEAVFALVYVYCESFATLLVFTILIAFFNSAPFSFIEGYVVPLGKKVGIPYPHVRWFGTLGYIVSLFLGYFLLQSLPIHVCFYFSMALFLASLGLSFLLPSERKEITREEGVNVDSVEDGRELFSVDLVFFLLFSFLFFGAFNASQYVLPLYLVDLGLSEADYSLSRSISLIGELVCLLLLPLLNKKFHRYKAMILVSALAILLSTSFGIYINHGYGLAYGALLASSIGKAFFFAFESYLLIDIVGERLLPKALVLISASMHLSSSVLNLLSGTIYESWTYPGYFALITGLETLGIVFLLLLSAKGKKESKDAEKAA